MNSKTFKKNAKYGFTLTSEFKKSVKLDSDETIVLKRKVRLCCGNVVIARLCLLMITSKRISLVKHYVFRPDIVISIALQDIREIQMKDFPFVSLSIIPPSALDIVYLEFLKCFFSELEILLEAIYITFDSFTTVVTGL